MDYEATDRYMSCWVVACTHNETRFYLNDEGTATDMLSRARLFRWADQALPVANAARLEPAWQGFNWQPFSVAEESAMGAAATKERRDRRAEGWAAIREAKVLLAKSVRAAECRKALGKCTCGMHRTALGDWYSVGNAASAQGRG